MKCAVHHKKGDIQNFGNEGAGAQAPQKFPGGRKRTGHESKKKLCNGIMNAQTSWEQKIAKVCCDIGYFRIIQQTLYSLVWTLVIKYFW